MSSIPSRLPTATSQLCWEQFDQGVNNLFSDESRVQFVQLAFRNPDQIHRTITSPSEWDEIVKIAGDQSLEHFCFITKRHSWSRILITRELLLRIISHYSIFLSFLRLVRLFGARLSEGNPSGGFFYRTWSAEPFSSSDDSLHKPCTGYELHYTLRYVEKHSRNMKIPWSMRQMAVCHRANIDNQFSSWILVHAGHDLKESLCARTDEYLSDGVEDRAATVHLTILHFAARNWSAYLDYLSSEFKQISDRARNCKVIKAKPGEDDEFEIGIQDMQWLQWLAEHLLITKHNLAENSHTINGLGQYLKRPKAVKRQGKEDHGHDGLACGEFPMWVAAWKDETRSNLDTLQTLMGQVRECTQLVFNILKIKDAEVIQAHGQNANTLNERSQQHSNALLRLAFESESAVRSMRTITLITLLYLPPSFLATLFGMNFFVVTSNGDSSRLGLLSDSWLYIATAVPLTVLTVVVWLCWDYREQLKFAKAQSLATSG